MLEHRERYRARKPGGETRGRLRQEIMNMRPGDQRRSLEHWKTRSEEEERIQRTKEEAWKLFERQPESKRKTREEFEEESTLKVRNATATAEKRKRRSCKSGQVKCRGLSNKRSGDARPGRERTWNRKIPTPTAPSVGEDPGTRSLLLIRHTFLRFFSDEPPGTIGLGFCSAVIHAFVSAKECFDRLDDTDDCDRWSLHRMRKQKRPPFSASTTVTSNPSSPPVAEQRRRVRRLGSRREVADEAWDSVCVGETAFQGSLGGQPIDVGHLCC